MDRDKTILVIKPYTIDASAVLAYYAEISTNKEGSFNEAQKKRQTLTMTQK